MILIRRFHSRPGILFHEGFATFAELPVIGCVVPVLLQPRNRLLKSTVEVGHYATRHPGRAIFALFKVVGWILRRLELEKRPASTWMEGAPRIAVEVPSMVVHQLSESRIRTDHLYAHGSLKALDYSLAL